MSTMKQCVGVPTIHIAKSGREMLATRCISPGSDKPTPEQRARAKYGEKK